MIHIGLRVMEVVKKSLFSVCCLVLVLCVALPTAKANLFVQPVDGGHDTSPKACFPAIFCFGDSLMDTGNNIILHPVRRGFLHNETYMSRPRDMQVEGRLIINFIAQSFSLASPSPYLRAIRPNFSNGVNFATFGATATNIEFVNPYTLDIQSYWLNRFIENVQRVNKSGSSSMQPLVKLEDFVKGLYVIAIGGNDYSAIAKTFNQSTLSMATNGSAPQLEVVTKLYNTTMTFLGGGARNFFIVNIPPIGCSILAQDSYRGYDLDEFGCVRFLNEVVDLHNIQLKEMFQNLRGRYSNASFVYADYNGVIRKMLSSKTVGGVAGRCPDRNSPGCYNNIHVTSEAANRYATQEILNGEFLEPPRVFGNCNLDLRLA